MEGSKTLYGKNRTNRFKLIDLNSPRSVFVAAYSEGVIDDEVIWSTIILKRNASVHTYNRQLAESLFAELPLYYDAMYNLLQRLKI